MTKEQSLRDCLKELIKIHSTKMDENSTKQDYIDLKQQRKKAWEEADRLLALLQPTPGKIRTAEAILAANRLGNHGIDIKGALNAMQSYHDQFSQVEGGEEGKSRWLDIVQECEPSIQPVEGLKVGDYIKSESSHGNPVRIQKIMDDGSYMTSENDLNDPFGNDYYVVPKNRAIKAQPATSDKINKMKKHFRVDEVYIPKGMRDAGITWNEETQELSIPAQPKESGLRYTKEDMIAMWFASRKNPIGDHDKWLSDYTPSTDNEKI